MYIDYYSGLLLIGFVQAVVVATLLLVRARREERLADLLAALLLIVGGLYVAQWMLGFGGWYDAHDWRTTFMFYVEWSNLTAMGPLIYFYFRALTNADFTWRRKYWWHFLPAAIFLLPIVAVNGYDWGYVRLLAGGTFDYFYATRGPWAEWENLHLAGVDVAEEIFARIQLLIYLVLTVQTYRRYRDYLRQELTNTAPLELRGIRNLMYLLLVGLVVTIAVDAVSFFFGEASYAGAWPKYLSMSILLFLAGLQFFRVEPVPIVEGEAAIPVPEPTTPANDEEAETVDLDHWMEKLETQLRTHRDYLDPNLRLGELARRIGTNSSVLSKAINRKSGVNYNDYVNGYRCAAFTERVGKGDHERHTFLSLALDCGFNSKSTFNRAFRKYAGKSPAEYVRSVPDHDLGRVKT